MPVFVDAARIDEIAGNKHGVGARIERVEDVDRAGEIRGSIDAAVGERARRRDVQIADLGEQHARISSSRTVSGWVVGFSRRIQSSDSATGGLGASFAGTSHWKPVIDVSLNVHSAAAGTDEDFVAGGFGGFWIVPCTTTREP